MRSEPSQNLEKSRDVQIYSTYGEKIDNRRMRDNGRTVCEVSCGKLQDRRKKVLAVGC